MGNVKRKATYQLVRWGYDSLRLCLYDIYQGNKSADWDEARRILLLENVQDANVCKAAIQKNSEKLREDWERWQTRR